MFLKSDGFKHSIEALKRLSLFWESEVSSLITDDIIISRMGNAAAWHFRSYFAVRVMLPKKSERAVIGYLNRSARLLDSASFVELNWFTILN